MTDKPIIFSGPMVRALLDGRKTMTRRLAWKEPVIGPAMSSEQQESLDARGWVVVPSKDSESTVIHKPSPWQKVAPGDRLWVREGMQTDSGRETLIYLADSSPVPKGSFAWQSWLQQYGSKGIPSIHMPRWASRITLIVEAVRVEPLKNISYDDVLAEGCPAEPDHGGVEPHIVRIKPGIGISCRLWYRQLWEQLHGPDSWDANPDIVALTFCVIAGNIDLIKEAPVPGAEDKEQTR